MNYSENKKYLTSNDIHFYVGWILLGIGAVLFALGEILWIYILPYQFFVSIFAAIAGALIAFLPRIHRGSAEALDEAVKKTTEQLSAKTVEALGKRLKNPGEAPSVVGHFLLVGEGILVRRGRKDQKYRSSRYQTAVIAFTKEGLYLLEHTFSLISDEASERVIEIPYTARPSAMVDETRLTLPQGSYVQKELLLLENGEERLRIPVPNSVFVDQICERIGTETKKAAKENAAKGR